MPMQAATILAIDDQDDNLALLEALLQPLVTTIYTALDGPTGLALARQHKPDLILLDLMMPGMDGFEVLERLRQDPATRPIPVIVLTANFRDSESVARGFELGATEYLTKPIQLDELVVRIRSMVRLATAERELARLRRDFASMLVHDMRAPLDGVRLVLRTLERQDPAHAELLGLALDGLGEVGQLIEDLLEVNRLEDEGFKAQLGPVAPRAVMAEALAAVKPVADARGLALALEAGEVPAVQADPRLLRRTLDNLLANALKFTEAGGVAVSARREGDAVVLAVADTGPGIAPEALPRIFDRYYTGGGSYGLGLAFCQKAVEAMGGRITAQSQPGQGTTFSIQLSVVPAEVPGRAG
jgi:signal transduction histidine kinase